MHSGRTREFDQSSMGWFFRSRNLHFRASTEWDSYSEARVWEVSKFTTQQSLQMTKRSHIYTIGAFGWVIRSIDLRAWLLNGRSKWFLIYWQQVHQIKSLGHKSMSQTRHEVQRYILCISLVIIQFLVACSTWLLEWASPPRKLV